jgi:hypothetical protein
MERPSVKAAALYWDRGRPRPQRAQKTLLEKPLAFREQLRARAPAVPVKSSLHEFNGVEVRR